MIFAFFGCQGSCFIFQLYSQIPYIAESFKDFFFIRAVVAQLAFRVSAGMDHLSSTPWSGWDSSQGMTSAVCWHHLVQMTWQNLYWLVVLLCQKNSRMSCFCNNIFGLLRYKYYSKSIRFLGALTILLKNYLNRGF